MSAMELRNVSFQYPGSQRKVLNNVSLTFESGKIYAIVGRSGSGKTTLLSVLSRLCAPTEGTILVDGQDVSGIDEFDFRSKNVGVIFQSFNLLPKLTAVENVELSMEIAGQLDGESHQKAMDLLAKMGLNREEAERRVLKLSGGQQQRVAIARALSYGANIILADEPTGNLDPQTQAEIIEIFKHLAYEEGKCVVIVTHSAAVANAADEVIPLASA